ncbi:MAG: sigma-70 family RNA polymerase sigma factor [Oscillochloris sp.]|nr:sigma-70 family RNA polymerase sigma factor [Oscillochloris sp.]
MIVNIRRDHSTIEALCRNSHMGHQAAWVSWLSHAMAILRHAHLDWARDGAVHIDDLAQIAMLELVRALPGFRYQSRFSTWAFQVITRGVQRHLRDMSAQKRVGNIDATVDPLTVAGAISEGEIPEAQAEAHLLTAIIDAELTAALGVRNAEVFRLWACDDLSAEMIGQRVGLSVARVYAVIAQSRQYLRGREVIRGWGDASEYV